MAEFKAECDEEVVKKHFRLIDIKRAAVQEVEEHLENELRSLANNAGKTFCYNGQWYQVSERMNNVKGYKVPYLRKLPGPPKNWLNK